MLIYKKKNHGSRLEVASNVAQPIQPNLGENGLDWLCYLAGNFQTTPKIFYIFRILFLYDFIKNPQTRNARTFLPLNISSVGSVFLFSIFQ